MPEIAELQPKPAARGWRYVGPWRDRQVLSGSVYQRGPVRVITALEEAEYPDGSRERGPQWHVSISRVGRRPRRKDVARVLRGLGLARVRPEEDNHHPGVARHFWLPVDPDRRVDCECKLTEEIHVEPDGYTWTNPAPGHGPCRGCEIAPVTGRVCPIHGGDDV